MGKIKDLITEYCPYGVNKYKLSDLVVFENGKGHEKVVNDNGRYILLTSKAISTNLNSYRRTNEQLSPLHKNDITMVMSDLPNGRALAKCFLVDQDNLYTLNQRVCRLTIKSENVLPKYLNYLLNRNPQLLKYDNGVDQTNLRKDDILKIELLIPPIEIQNEIVIILEKISKLELELETALKTEFEVRKSQYEFWHKKIINSNDNLMKINEVCNTAVGGDVPKNYFSSEKTEKYSIPIYSNSIDKKGLYGYTNINKISKPCVTLSGRGAGVGHAFLRKEPFFPIIRLICLIPKEELITAEYLYYAIQLVKFKIPTTGIPQLTVPMISEYKIPVPSLDEQKRIVTILDKFEKLANDIAVDLSEEIELRRKQYEYYRNKLLSFEELSVSE